LEEPISSVNKLMNRMKKCWGSTQTCSS